MRSRISRKPRIRQWPRYAILIFSPERAERRLFTIAVDGEFLIVAHTDHLIWA